MINSPKKTRRFFRFGLRRLFVLVFLIACGFGVYAWLLRDIRRQQAIEAELEALGCSCMWNTFESSESDSDSWTQRWVFDTLGIDASARINEITCDFSSDEQLRAVLSAATRLQSLKQLSFRAYPGRFSREATIEVRTFRALPDVEVLKFTDVVLNEKTLEEISRMTGLRELVLCNVKFTNSDVSRIAELESLEHLDLSATNVASCRFSALVNLEYLDLSATYIGDAIIDELISCKNLARLNINSAGITPAGLQRLRQALPNTEIITDK